MLRASKHPTRHDTTKASCQTRWGIPKLTKIIAKSSSHNLAFLTFFPPLKNPALKSETDPSIFKSLFERGDLDFVEQLWVRMRKSESVSEKQSWFDEHLEWEAAIRI